MEHFHLDFIPDRDSHGDGCRNLNVQSSNNREEASIDGACVDTSSRTT
jgi:hypothetical protein